MEPLVATPRCIVRNPTRSNLSDMRPVHTTCPPMVRTLFASRCDSSHIVYRPTEREGAPPTPFGALICMFSHYFLTRRAPRPAQLLRNQQHAASSAFSNPAKSPASPEESTRFLHYLLTRRDVQRMQPVCNQ